MSTERIVLRAFGGDEGVAEELLDRGFAPGLMETREGREVARALLDLRSAGALPTLENLRQTLSRQGSLPARLRRYLVQLEMTPRCSRLHAVAHLQLLKLDLAMECVDRVCRAVASNVGLPSAPGLSEGRQDLGEPPGEAGARPTPETEKGRGLERGPAVSRGMGPKQTLGERGSDGTAA